MKQFRLWVLACLLCAGARGYGQDAQLTKVLGQLDAAAARFHSAQASFTWDQLTVVVQEHDVQTGTIAFRRGADGAAMAAHVATENGQAAPKDVLFRKGELDLYQPLIKQETVVKAGANQSQFESFATLGFGGSGKDLQANWNVAYGGSDTIDGVSVSKLVLTPKNPGPNPLFTKVEIWIDPQTATSRKQIFYTPSGDSRTATYTGIKLNQATEQEITLSVPKGTTVVPK